MISTTQPMLAMNLKTPAAINSEEIACLAYLNWEKDGCPPQLALDYWLEAEHQIKATKHLMLTEMTSVGVKNSAVTSARSKTKRKVSAGAKRAKCV